MEHGNMQTDQLKKHLQLFTEGTTVPPEDLPGGDAPAPAAAGDPDPVPIPPATVARIWQIYKRSDAILKSYTDPKTGKPFESINFESMTESEQRQYIMQNLHQLSEADQMVVLRAITTEGIGKDFFKAGADAVKWGAEKAVIPAVKYLANKGEQIVGWGAKTGEKIVSGVFNQMVVPIIVPLANRLGTAGGIIGIGYVLIKNWPGLFTITPDMVKNLKDEDLNELKSLYEEANELLAIPKGLPKTVTPDNYWAWPKDLAEYATDVNQRWQRFNEVAKASLDAEYTPAGADKSVPDLINDKVKSWLKK
jgi:hypothetical protein